MAGDRIDKLYNALKADGTSVPSRDIFRRNMLAPGKTGYNNRLQFFKAMKADGADVGNTYEDFAKSLGLHAVGTPTVNKYRQQLFNAVDPTKNKASELTRKAVKTAHKAMDNVRKPVRGAVVNKQGKKVEEFDITPAKTLDDLNREYAQEVASDWEKEQQRQSLYNTTRSLDEVQRKIAERDAQLDEADNGFWTGIRHAAQGMNVTGGMFQQYDDDMRKELIDPKYKQYLVEANYLTQMKKQLIQEEEDAVAPNATKWDRFKHASSSFTSGMVDEAFGSDAFDFGGYNQMRESDVLLRINDRINRGVATDDDRRLLQILKDKEEVESRLDNDAYSFGRGASQSAGYVTDFLITGGGDFGGLGRLGGKMALGLARKTFAKTMTKDLGKRFAAWSLKNLGKTLGEATGAAMTATSVQIGKTAGNATQRYLGLDSDDGGLEYDKDGNLKFKGGTDVGTAIAKAIASGTIENYTELLGPHITSMGKRLFGWAGVGLEKITPDALSKFFDKVGSSELFKRIGTFTDEVANSKVLNAGKNALAKVGVNDMPEEGLEEEAGIILNSLITGDNKFSDLWDKETQYKTWGGVMSMMGAMRAIPIASSAVGGTYSASKNKLEYFKCKHDLTKAETLARQALGDKWTPIKELIDNADNKHIIEVGVNIIRQSDKYSQEQAKAAENYIGQLLKMRGFNNATMASIRDKNAKGEEQTDADKRDIEVSNAYAEGHEAEGEFRHMIQLEYEKRKANLAKRLGLTPEKIEAMNVGSFSSYSGLYSDADFDIFQYKKAKAAYDGVMDNAQNLVDIAGEVAAQRVDNMTNVHDGTIRKAFKKGTEMNPDSPVYIISGNIVLNDDGSINYTDSDKMIVIYDEETGQREAIGNFMLASVDPNMQNAEEVKAQAIIEAKQKIITEQSNVIDGVLVEGSEFTMEGNDGISHNYNIVQVDEQGNCIVSVDGTVLPEPLSLDAIQQQYDQSNVARSVKNDQTTQEPEQAAQEPEQTQQESQPIEDKFDYGKITNENDGNVKSVVVTDEEGKNRFPNAKAVFLIQDQGAMPKFVVMDEEGNLTSFVGKRGDKIQLSGEMTVDDYKKQRQEELQMIAAENANSSMIEDNSGENRGEIEAETPAIEDAEPIGTGVFGNIYNQFKGKVKEAFNFLMHHKSGDLLGVFHRDDVGDIDLVWGDENMGLAHILGKHVGEGKDFETPDDAVNMIENVINNGSIMQETPNRYVVTLDGFRVGIRKEFDGEKKNWIVTAIDYNRSKEEKGIVTNPTSASHGVEGSELAAPNDSDGKDINNSSNNNENNESLTFEDGTPIPVDENGETDLSQTDAAHAAEWYDNNLDEDADVWLDGEVKKYKKLLEQAKNKKLTGNKPSELVASKKEKEAVIADVQAHYDSAISIRDSLKERRIAKEEITPEGRKNLIEKARRKFARLKSSVKDDAEAVAQLYRDTVGSLLNRLYDGTGIDVTDTVPLTAEEYVASNLGAHSLNYEGNETSKGVKQETGLSREDFAKTQLLAADGKGTTIDALVHSLWDNRPSNLESLDTQDIRNALIDVLTSGFKASEARSYIENIRIAQAEKLLEEQELAAENAAYAEQQKAKEEEEKKNAELEKKAEEEKKKAELEGEETNPLAERVTETDEEFESDGEYGTIYNKVYLIDGDKRVTKVDEPDAKGNYTGSYYMYDGKRFGDLFEVADYIDGKAEEKNFPDKLKEGSETIEVPEDATEEKPLGEQRTDSPFSARKNGKQQTEAERAADVEKNKVDDVGLVDAVIGEKIRKSFERIAKMMGAKIQYQRTDKLGNGWIQETKDADGNVHRTIFITLDSSITEGAQFIFGHEMTHQIKNLNPAAYNELTQLVLDTYGADAFDKAVDKTMQRYSDAGFSGRARDYYAEEVVADAVGEMIRDLNLAHTLAMKMSHPLLAAIHEILQKIKLAFFGTEYSDVTKNIIRSIEQAYVKTANGQVTNSETGEDVSFSLRQKPEPKKKGVGYKVFVLKDGKLYPPMVANPDGAATPVGVWLDADAAPIAGESKTGRPQVKQGGKGTQGGSGKLAYRPGWHLGVVPYAIQFNRKDADGNKTLFPKNFVFAEVEYAADVDYQEEARQEGINPSGKYQHSLAGLKHLPTDGYYMYRTNPNPETDPWVITGAMKVNRILTRAEQAELVKNAGREPQQIQEGDIVTDDVVNSINQEIAAAPKFSLKVYHGSGADFTEFDFDHMGEGAGSQAFGWGGYVTSSKKIGKSYAEVGQQSAESRRSSYDDTPLEAAVGSILGQEMYNYMQAKTFEQKKAQAIKNAENSIDSFSDMLKNSNELDEKSRNFLKKSIEKDKKKLEVLQTLTKEQYKEEYIKQGRAKNLYEVEIPEDNGGNYLEWEKKPSDEVATKIIEGLYGLDAKTLDDMAAKDIVFRTLLYDYIKNANKAQMVPLLVKTRALTRGTTYDNGNVEDDIRFVYTRLSNWMGSPKAASQFLSSIGYTGIKYPAGTIQGGAEEGDTNYVIFNPEDMQITEHTKFSLRLKSAIDETETNPSDAQKESGNYKKGHIKFGGYDYTIENPKGSIRSGKDANGKEWKVTMHDTYGYIRGKFGKDGDHLDMFINDKADLDNWNGDVFVVDQVNPDGSFDEHKVMYGYDSMSDAEKAYLANYSKGWQGLGGITGASKAEFDKWLDTSNRKLKPFADYAKIKFSQAQSVTEPRYSLDDIKPVGVGAFGNIYNQFRGKAKAAIEFLKKVRGGEAVGALHHKDIGDIDLVWGKEGTGHSDGYGLSKLVKYHPEVLDNLQEILNDMRVVSSSKNRVNLESETHKAGVRLTWDGERKSWLLTAFKKETSASDKRTDTAATSLEGDTALSQTEGSAAKIDNSSETSKENGEKFSLKDEKTMFGMHNISIDKLRKAIKQGGFAAPSMGVVDSKNGIYSGYGEITLIPKAEKIAKRTGKNIGTYAADAWTPIYPPVEKKFGGNGSDVAYNDIESVPKEIQRLTRNAINSFMDGREANGLAYLYLHEKGKAPELVHVEGKYPKELHDEVKGILGKLDGIYSTTDEQKEELLDLFIREVYDGNREEFDNDIKKLIKKDEEFIKKRPNSNISKDKQLDVDWMKEHGYDYGALSRFVDGILRDAETSGKVDENATMKAAQQYIQDKGMKEDFDSWKEKLNDRYQVEEVIFAGYKADGNRKYLPNTVENAVKVMKQDGKNASVGSASFSHFVASILKPMGTLDQIRKKKGNLTGNYEDVEKFQEKWQPVYDELADKMQPGAGAFESYGMDRLEEAATQKNPKKYAKEEYGVDLTDEDINKLNELIEAVKNDKPSIYFETKFMRPYGLDEFEKAIVPNDTPSDVVDALKMAGIDVSSYERGNAEDRQKVTMDAINSSDNIRFSLKSMMEKPEGWKQANKKAIHIAEAIERDPKFSLKKLDGTLIKAGTYFSGGGLVEEGLKGIIDPVVAVEYDEKISGVYRNNFGQHIVTADVRDVDPKELVKQIDGEVEYFHASPVCKNYSQAKSNHAELELDKETAASTAEFINAVKPKVVTIENVKGYKDSDAMKTITDALDANGYTWDADVYNAADYGGYTNRERLIVRAVRDGKLPEKPKKMAHKSGWYEAVADIIPTLTEKKNGVAPWMDVRLKADGIDWRNIDKPLYVMGSAYADGKVPHAFADELLPTLRTKSGDVIVMPDGKVYRAMGRVLARVSGVSDDYKMPFSESLSHTIIGNGIPTQLTEHVIAPLVQNTLRPTSPEEGNTKFSIRQFGTDIADASDKIKNLMNNEKIISRRIGSRAQAQSRVLETISRASDEFRRSNRASAKSGQDTWEKDRALGYVIRASYGTGSFLTEEEIKEITSGKVGNGQENQVYLSKDGKTVIKLNNLLMVDREFRFNEFLDRIKAHNEFAPDDMYTPLGFALNEDGDFCLVLEQPYVKGEPATQEEIDDYMESHGYDLYPVRVSADEVGAGWSNGEFEIWDTKPRNVLKDKNGDLHFIDTVIQHAFIDGHNDKLRLSLRGSTPYDKQMEEWKEKNHLEKDAVPMEKPIKQDDENIFDYMNRMVEWTRNQSLWKTAPKQTGFQDALDKWKADNGLSPDAYPPVRPHRENYSTEIGYAEDLEEYNKKKELWKSAPKPKDFDLSVDLEDMNKQLRNIRRAVLNQKNYDQRTVKAVSDLVRKMLNIGWGDGLSRGKVGNLLSAAKNATGANDVKKYLDKAMGILAENYLNRLSTAYDNLINTKGARADQSGVIKMGSLDAKGQAFMSEYKKAINMDDKSLNTYIANIEEDSAKNEANVEMNDYRLAGIQAAIIFKQQIGGNDADVSELQRQIGELKNKKDATKEDKDLLKSLEKKLFENKFDRITMYENLLNNIQRMVTESKGRAKEFREEIAEHKNEILHRANLDLEGVVSTYYDTTTAKKKLVNNVFQRAAFSSTYTFEQFLKFFGKKAANGEGYLYNYFTKLNQDALDEEQLYNEMNRNALDEKTKELFGKKKFMKLVGIDGKGMKEMDIEVTDYSNKETGKRTIHLKQGQMLYIYLVNKETDGEMKLRAMGITEEDVAAIEANLDPRVKAMGEWLQDEYLPECQRRYQATHTKYFGAPMKEVENYFPLAINNRARNVKEDVNQDSDAMSQLAGTSTGAIVTRRVNVIPLDIENADAFEVAFNHLQEMEEWSAMLPFRQDVNTLLSYTHFRNQVQNMSSVAYGSGKTLWDEFKQTAQIAAGTYKPKMNAGMMDSRIAAAMGGIAVAKISGRLWTAIKQSQSATVFLPECDFTRFVKNGVNPYGSWKWAMENIPDFRKRVENITYGDVKLRQYLDELEKYHDWTKVISKLGMAPNILVDGVTCAVGARSVYETEVNRLTKLGYPKEKAEEKAYYKAVAAYNKTQQSSGGMYLSPMQVDRTYVSAALSLFKNANFAYGRMQIEACRGLARTYDFWGGKHKTALIESMTRQIMEEDGLDENTARAIAKATYNRTFRQSIGRLINFATLVPVSWALYQVLPYLLTGDDDDKKKDMIEEAVLKGFATSLSDNYVIPFASNILNAGLKVEDGKPTFDPEVFRYQNLYINPATSDLANIYSMIGNQKWYSVANKFGMLGVQSLIGFNPETVGSLYQAFAEADKDNGNTAKEWQIGILKAISAPEESIRELYMDELGLKSGDIKKIPLAELEKRYAERQINRDNLLSQIFMDAESFNGYVDKYQKSFEKKIKDKMDKWDEYDKKKADEFFDTTTDPKLKDMIAKKRVKDANAAADEQIAKEGLNQDKKGKEPYETAYDAVKMSIDVAEDNAISTYNKVLNKRYAALNDEYNNQTDAMKYIFMNSHPNFKAYKDIKSEYTNYGKKMKELKEKLVSADGYDVKQTILKQIRTEREKFSELQSKVR